MEKFLNLPHNANWQTILPQFNVLIAKYESLLSELEQPVLKKLIIHPQVLLPDDPEFFARVLFRTKLIPEIEELEESILNFKQNTSKILPNANDNINILDENMVKNNLRNWEIKMERHDQISIQALKLFESFKNEFEYKKRLPIEVEDLKIKDEEDESDLEDFDPDKITKMEEVEETLMEEDQNDLELEKVLQDQSNVLQKQKKLKKKPKKRSIKLISSTLLKVELEKIFNFLSSGIED
ncbi:hypothetical protein HDU92_000366 [Lobulomyces angularis]|nr:hypothetical protein HDU92_000366 [Lobulomyces angularis]